MQYSTIEIPTDLDSIKQTAEKAFSATPDANLEKWFSFPEMEQMIKQKRGICIKAIDETGEIVGMIYAQQENPINGQEGLEKWVINIIAVNPNVSGKGIGSGLLSAIENTAKERGCIKMFVYTNKNDKDINNFYKKNSYEDAGWIRDYQYGENNSAVFLLKYL